MRGISLPVMKKYFAEEGKLSQDFLIGAEMFSTEICNLEPFIEQSSPL